MAIKRAANSSRGGASKKLKKSHGKSTSESNGKSTKQPKEKKLKGAPSAIPAVENDSDVDVDDMPIDVEQDDMGFLAGLDKKGIAKSRLELRKEYRAERPASQKRKSTFKVSASADDQAPRPSELKALKRAHKKAKRKGEEFDEQAFWREQRELARDGELLDDLDEDDLAFGSGDEDDDDDDLSVMSDWSGPAEGEFDDETDLGSTDDDEEDDDEFDDLDDDSNANSASVSGSAESEEDSEESDEDGSLSSQSESAMFSDEDEDLDYDELFASDSDDAERGQLRKQNKPSKEERVDLEDKYARQPFKQTKEKVSTLPVIANGKIVPGRELSRSLSPSPERSPTPPPISEVEYKADPLGKRFGRPAVRSILEIKNRSKRLAKAREEIASLGNEASAIGEGEGGLNLVRRLLSLTGRKFKSTTTNEKPLIIDVEIRAMAMISLVAVLVDTLPDYRIRALTEAERSASVSQAVMRQREWEEGIVDVYKRFLTTCEGEVSNNTELAVPALHSLCTLVQKKSDFNFAINIMDVVVKRLGRKGWDDGHQMCLNTIAQILVNDTTTTATNSLHIVRLISRLVRARSFGVRPEVVSVLLNLRLKDELSSRFRASTDSVEREGDKTKPHFNKFKQERKGKKGGRAKAAMSKVGSKKARQAMKEKEAIEKEMREAEGEVNRKEREQNMTETLKLLFALYFRILKTDHRTPLLPAALEGIARFAHLVNIDFFRDLLETLKGIISRGSEDVLQSLQEDEANDSSLPKRNDNRERLLCIVTAFELLHGQGESLTVDLGEFVSALYAVLLPLAFSTTLEEIPRLGQNELAKANRATAKLAQTEADLVFRALTSAFLTARTRPPAVRTLAFSKRLLTVSLNWPPATQRRTIAFLKSLLIKEPRLESMLETSDRKVDGKWNGTVNDPERAQPESTSWWEAVLLRKHVDEHVREDARKLMNWTRED